MTAGVSIAGIGVRSRAAAAALRAWATEAFRYLQESYTLEQSRHVLWLPVGIGAGIGYYFALPVEPHWSQGPTAVALAGAALLVLRAHRLEPLAAVALAAAVGLCAAQLRTAAVAAPFLSMDIGLTTIEGRILALHGKSDGAVRVILAPSSVQYLEPQQVPARVRISLTGSTADLRPGQIVRLKAMLAPTPGPVLPGAFDFARSAWFEGIGASGYSRGNPAILETVAPATVLEVWSIAVADWRFEVARRIRAALPGVEGSLAAALITGDRGFVPESDMDALRNSSLAHILSISGLHMAIVGLGIFSFVRLLFALVPRVALRIHTKKWAAGIALVATFVYLILSGSAVPAIRSFMMIALMFLAVMLDRPAITMRTVALAGALILLVAPESLLDPSFQMSFAAVVALIAAHEALVTWRQERGEPLWPPGLVMRGLTYLGGAAFTSFVAGLATAPFAAFHFARYASYGVAANVLAMPIVGFVVMPFGAASLLLMPLGLEAYALAPMGWGIRLVLDVAHWVASWPGAVAATPAWPLGPLLLAALGGLWMCIWRGSWRLLGIAPLVLAFAWSLATRTPDLIVDSQGRNIAVLGEDGRYLLYDDKPKFEVERWLERFGDARLAREIRSSIPGLACKEGVCEAKVQRNGRTWRIAFMTRSEKAKLCPDADILVAYSKPQSCSGTKLTLDGKGLRQGGAHVVWLDEGGARLDTVTASRGLRPWVVAAP